MPRSTPSSRSNIRIADQRIGDIRAQAAALKVGERRLTELIDRYGKAVVVAAIGEMRTRAARLMRAHIAEIPDGVYRSEAFVDSDGVVNEPLKIALSVTKSGDTLGFDFAGSSPPCRGPMNSVLATTYSAVYLAVRHIFPDIPLNSGAFEPLQIKRPRSAPSSTRSIRAPCRAARRRCRSASPKRCSWRWCRPSRTR